MGRDDFSVSPAYSGTEVSNKPLIVEDQPRVKGCSCCLLSVALVAAVGVIVVGMLDPLQMNLELLAVDSPEVKVYAINNLADHGDPGAVDALADMLSSPDPEVRNAAAWALGEIRSAEGINPLFAVVDTGADYDLSYYAVSSLLAIASRCPDGAPRGEVCADDTLAGEVSDYLVERAGTDALIAYIVSNSLFDDDVDVRILAAQLLVYIATEDERKDLEAAAEGDGDKRVREAANMALAELDARTSPEMDDATAPTGDTETVPAEPSENEPPMELEPVTEPL